MVVNKKKQLHFKLLLYYFDNDFNGGVGVKNKQMKHLENFIKKEK